MHLVKKLLIKRQASIGSAAIVLMSMVLLSRLLGLVRDRLLVSIFPPELLGIYFAAFRLPNMIFELLVTGALTTAFIPVFTRLLTKKSEEEAWHMASVVMNYGVIILLIVSLPIIIFADQISSILAPGFSPEQRMQMAYFTRIMILGQVLPLMLGNFLTGILQSYQLFFLPAVAPVFYNIGIICGVFLLSKSMGIMAPVFGVILGAFFFFLVQLPAIFALKYKHRWSFDTHIDGVKEVARLMAPRTLGLAVSQIDTTTDLALSSFLGSRMVTVFNFAQTLQQLPIGLFGATIAQAALPTLSRSSAREEKSQFRSELISAIHQILFFVLPLSMVFIVLRIPITRIVYGTDRFDWQATVLTGETLSAFSISLCAQAMIQLLARAFYALYDTKTPVIIGTGGILLNVFCSILFVRVFHFPVWSLGLSTSIATIIHVFILIMLLQKRIGKFSFNDIVIIPLKILLAAGIMGIVIFGLQRLLDQLVFDTTRTFNLLLLVVTIGTVGLILYMFLSWVLGVGQVRQFMSVLRKITRMRKMFPIPFFSSSETDHPTL